MSIETLMTRVSQVQPSIQGWCSLEKAQALCEAILSAVPELCVEIGVFGGSSLIPQAMALKENGRGIIHGIDPWSVDAALEEMHSPENKEWWGKKVDLEGVYKHCCDNIRHCGVQDYCRLIRQKAEDVVTEFFDESIDILHIDGNHSEALSYKDATLYLPKVKRGGLIFFDDIWWADGQEEATTRKAIVFLQESCVKLRLVGKDCMILQKL